MKMALSRIPSCGIATALLLLAVALPLHAAEGLRAGVFKVYPAVAVDVAYDSNIYLERDNPTDDYILSVSPSLGVFLPLRRVSFLAEAKGSFIRYLDATDQNSDNSNLGCSLKGDFPGGLQFELADRYQHQFLNSQAEFDVAEYYTLNQFYANGAYTLSDTLKLSVQYYNYLFAYQKTNDLDRVENTYAGTLFWLFKPRTSALLELGYSGLVYSDAAFSDKDNSSFQGRVGLTWQATGKTKGDLRVGLHHKDYTSGVTGNRVFVVASTSAVTELTRYTSTNLDLRRATVESDYTSNPYYLSTRLSLGIVHRFTYKISGDAGIYARWDEYPNATTEGTQTDTRFDAFLGGGLGLEFRMFRWLALAARYTYVNRNCNLDTFDYDDHKFDITAKMAF